MRYASVVALSALLGLGIGVAMSVAEFGIVPLQSTLAMGAGHLRSEAAGPPPKAVVEEADYDFGDMEDGTVGRHTFVVRNEGPGVLEISPGTPPCKCTVASVSHRKIAAKESTEVTVEWRPGNIPGAFRRTVSVLTNDPLSPTINFNIHGLVQPMYRLEPAQLMADRISPKESREVETKLLVFRQNEVEILGHQWSDKATQEFFGLTYEPLSAEDLASDKAKCGYRIRVTIRPGLPLGPLSQTLQVKSSLKTSSRIILPLYGQVAPEVSFVGPVNFDRDRNILRLGTIPQGTHMSTMLSMLLAGQNHNRVQVKVSHVTPSDLKVTLGPPKTLLGGHSTQIPITIEVPESAAPVALLGTEKENMGQIVLESNHPDYKEVRIYVEMAVTDRPSPPSRPDQ